MNFKLTQGLASCGCHKRAGRKGVVHYVAAIHANTYKRYVGA